MNKVLPKLIHLSYLDPLTAKYYKGLDDLYFIGFWVVIWLSLREILMKLFFYPLGFSMGLGKNKLQRFSEQGWTLVYCSIFWCMGIVSWCLTIPISVASSLIDLADGFHLPGNTQRVPRPDSLLEHTTILARLSSNLFEWPEQILLSLSDRILVPTNFCHSSREAPQRLPPNVYTSVACLLSFIIPIIVYSFFFFQTSHLVLFHEIQITLSQ